MRLFIAIPISDNIKRELGHIQSKLTGRITREKVRWVSPENIHLTLNFLGEVEADMISPIKECMQKAVYNIFEFRVSIENIGAFPNKKKPRVLWVGCKDKEGVISSIEKNLSAGLIKFGFKREKRKYLPHLTLGRIKHVRGKTDRMEFNSLDNVKLGTLKINQVQLIESCLRSKGADYTTIESVKF